MKKKMMLQANRVSLLDELASAPEVPRTAVEDVRAKHYREQAQRS